MTTWKPECSLQTTALAQKMGPFASLGEDVRRGLTKIPKELPPKYFYDAYGGKLFDRICDLPEYYLTQTEQALLEKISEDLIASCRPTSLVEFGSGSCRKTRVLLDAMSRRGCLDLYIPIDLNEDLIQSTARTLQNEFPGLQVCGVTGDFNLPVELPPREGRRLVAFLGSTIGNLAPQEAISFLRSVANHLSPQDCFLLGTDLVKDRSVLERAYNDAAGVTAQFNRNMLSVINRHLGADFQLDWFEHLAFYNEAESRVEMHLVARKSHRVWIEDIGLAVDFTEGESIRTEISCKYTRGMVEKMLEEAGLQLLRWEMDADNLFALSVSAVCR